MGQGQKGPNHGNLSCSFCGKGQREVRKLIAGPGVNICDECIELCHDIMAEELVTVEERGARPLPPSADDPQAMAALLIKACEADPRVPRIITDLAIALAVELDKSLDPPGGQSR